MSASTRPTAARKTPARRAVAEAGRAAATAPPASPAVEPKTGPFQHSTRSEGGFLSGLTNAGRER